MTDSPPLPSHQFLRTPSSFAFRAVSGPLIFTAFAVINALRRPAGGPGLVPAVSPLFVTPDLRYQVHSVLQFVPAHMDVRVCNFSERVERGLTAAYAEMRRRSHEAGSVTVQVSPDIPARKQKIFILVSNLHFLPWPPAAEHHHGHGQAAIPAEGHGGDHLRCAGWPGILAGVRGQRPAEETQLGGVQLLRGFPCPADRRT